MSKKSSNRAAQSRKSFWTPMRIGLIGSALVLAAAITSVLFRSATGAPELTANTPNKTATAAKAPAPATGAPGNPAAAALSAGLMETSFPLLDGSQSRLSNYAGKVVVVDLWATWCGPCRQEIPHLIELAKEFKGRGLEVVGLTTENPAKDTEKVRQFVAEFKINYPVGWADEGFAQGLMKGHSLIPQTYVIGRDGQVKKYIVGFNPQTGPSQLRAAVEEAIAAE